jgi:hypothetical protein
MSDKEFSDDERRVLASVLDEIIPPSDDGELPGAGQAGVLDYIEKVLSKLPDLRSMITQGLSDLDRLARDRGERSFLELPRSGKQQVLGEQAFVFALTLHTYVGYYQNDRVVEALGLEPRPPHPKGYEMEPDDLALLDAVRRRPRLYRQC